MLLDLAASCVDRTPPTMSGSRRLLRKRNSQLELDRGDRLVPYVMHHRKRKPQD